MNTATQTIVAAMVAAGVSLGGLVMANPPATLRILPLGDSNTKGTYLAFYTNGPYAGQAVGVASPLGGSWRKMLQDKLRAAGVAFEFVGELDSNAYGSNGVVDAHFSPLHHGLSGFGNREIIKGGSVPAQQDINDAKGVQGISVPGIITVLKKHQPNVILLMSGANGFDPTWRDRLIRTIAANSTAELFVATIPPQRAPREDWEQVVPYNRFLPLIVDELASAAHPVHLVDMYAVLSNDDLMPDGVHVNSAGMKKIADAWFAALESAGLTGKPANAANSAEAGKKALALAAADFRKQYARQIEETRELAVKETGLDAGKGDILKLPVDFIGGEILEYDNKCPKRFASCIRGKLSYNATLKTRFACDPFSPAGAYSLQLWAQDDEAEKPCSLRISVNGKAVFEGPSPFVCNGWSRQTYSLPSEALKRDNALVIECTDEGSTVQRGAGAPWFMVNYAVIKKTAP